jgi:UDP-glucose 4-epimerase
LNSLSESNSFITVNLGTGRPYSVLDMVYAFEKASGKNIPYEIVSRRLGDLPEYYTDPALAKKVLGWEAKLGIDRMCADTWRWQQQNPNGYS